MEQNRTDLQSVLPGESLLTKRARERLHGQMNLLVSFQVVVPVEALYALVALEGSILRCLMRMRLAIDM